MTGDAGSNIEIHSTLLQNPTFPLDYSTAGSEKDCIGQQRTFSTQAAYATEEEQARRLSSFGNTLPQPDSSPTGNGFRFSNTQQPSVNDVQFPSLSGLLMSPPDSCTGTSGTVTPGQYTSMFSSNVSSSESVTSTSVYSNLVLSSPLAERTSNFRSPRVPALPPSTLSNILQTQGSSLSAIPGMVGRDGFPSGYPLRNSFSSQQPTGIGTMARYAQYSIPPTYGTPADSAHVFFNDNNSLLLHQQRNGSTADAPLFAEIEIFHEITVDGQRITPTISARFHRGFFKVDNKWTCYRRNYFAVTCSFSLTPSLPQNTIYYLQIPGQRPERIHNFSMAISAVVNSPENETRELVQHSPKRDKKSEKKPDRVILDPTHPYLMGSNASGPGGHQGQGIYGLGPQAGTMTADYNQPFGSTMQTDHPTQHTFRRIQFQKATANNGKRRAQQQFYNLIVELQVGILRQGQLQWIKVAQRRSDPVVVRGRSPGHYKDGKRNRSTSMGPDSGGLGSGGDGARGTMIASGLAQFSYAGMTCTPYDATNRGTGQFGRQHQTTFGSLDPSPSSTSPLMSSSSGSPFDCIVFNDRLDGVPSMDGAADVPSAYQDASIDLHRKQSAGALSRHSHLSSGGGVEFSPHSDEPPESNDRPFEDAFESVVSNYPREPDDESRVRKSTTSGMDRRQLPMLTFENNRTRATEGSYGRFDPIQSSLCVRMDRPMMEAEERPLGSHV